MKSFIKLTFMTVIAVVMIGCTKAPSNVHVISTSDCGVTWEKVQTGTAVSKHTGNTCGYNLAIPNWPMPGDTQFKTQFAGKVLTDARISYTYNIVDPLKFIKSASYLGKMGGSLEISAEDVGAKYEMAENLIMDKTLRKITSDITEQLEIVDANPAEVEEEVFKKVVEVMGERGVAISDLALIINPDEQTRLAIDVATAMRVYENAGIKDAGKAIAIARAGATKITVTNENEKEKK